MRISRRRYTGHRRDCGYRSDGKADQLTYVICLSLSHNFYFLPEFACLSNPMPAFSNHRNFLDGPDPDPSSVDHPAAALARLFQRPSDATGGPPADRQDILADASVHVDNLERVRTPLAFLVEAQRPFPAAPRVAAPCASGERRDMAHAAV